MFYIAIPSYRRTTTLVKKTLMMLLKAEMPGDNITIFVASEEEAEMYRQVVIFPVVVGLPGIHQQRRFIESYYSVGSRVLCIDDDVSKIKMKVQMPLAQAVDRMFDITAKEGAALFGINPCSHTLGLKDEYTVGLSYCIGAFQGIIIKDPKLETSPSPFYEDFWRTVKAYQRDGKVVRFNGLAPVTRYFSEAGGLQEFRTPTGQEDAMKDFKERFPTLCILRVREGKMTDVRIRPLIQKRAAFQI
jgi:hypothetical protein